MKKVTIFDTSIATMNIGDQIIMDAVNKELSDIIDSNFVIRIPTHEKITEISIKKVKDSEWAFFGGTNAISSNMDRYRQWKIGVKEALSFHNVILMGVGWWQYQDKPNAFTRFLLKNLLSKDYYHSVRDSYTYEKLKSIGMDNVINTGCPTTWCLTKEHCETIPEKKANKVITTLTDYYMDNEKDSQLLDTLTNYYEEVYLWVQGPGDYEYAKSLNKNVKFINPSLKSYDLFLSNNEDLDYVGTRLHAGIRAMQHKRRSIIIAVDNRAVEMGKDSNLNVIKRSEQDKLDSLINNNFKTEVKVNYEAVNKWRAQFK